MVIPSNRIPKRPKRYYTNPVGTQRLQQVLYIETDLEIIANEEIMSYSFHSAILFTNTASRTLLFPHINGIF